jgi:L,D-peptidoglycan transpeptidase YkuD (ErfK/YbiS/YcfS/YnhG family)
MNDITLISPSEIECAGQRFRCVIGKAGVVADKREGDHATPAGSYPLRQVFYRPDRLPEAPQTALPITPISPYMCWCDAPEHAEYNQLVMLPFSASHELLWREDHAYDIVIVVGYNDDPVTPGKGSAIFMNLVQPDWCGTEGCIALTHPDMLALVALLQPASQLHIPAVFAA